MILGAIWLYQYMTLTMFLLFHLIIPIFLGREFKQSQRYIFIMYETNVMKTTHLFVRLTKCLIIICIFCWYTQNKREEKSGCWLGKTWYNTECLDSVYGFCARWMNDLILRVVFFCNDAMIVVLNNLKITFVNHHK